jgi:hypothetical protein
MMDSAEAVQNLTWWEKAISDNTPRTLVELPPQATITTDAAKHGWSAHVDFLESGA